MEQVYSVYEKDERNQYLCEYFGTDRESAIKYLKMRVAILDQELKEWKKEVGIYYYIWRNEERFREIQLKVLDVEKKEVDSND